MNPERRKEVDAAWEAAFRDADGLRGGGWPTYCMAALLALFPIGVTLLVIYG